MTTHTHDASNRTRLPRYAFTVVALIVFLYVLDFVPAASLAQSASPGGLHFDVSSIKKNDTRADSSFQRLPGGRLHIVNNLLRNLILLAFDFSPDQLVGAPDWINQEHTISKLRRKVIPPETK